MIILYYFIIKPISLLPYFILYKISDILYVLLYYIIGYRKSVVLKNLNLVFPKKSKKEIKKIVKSFYKHFADIMIESIKNYSISLETAKKRMICLNPKILDDYIGKNIIITGGHYNNWELYAMSASSQMKHKLHAIYTPIQNRFMNAVTKKSRENYGLKMLPKKEVRSFMSNLKNKESHAIVFAIDQSPSKNQKVYWLNFLNQKSATQFGTEKYAKEMNLPVFFGEIQKLKRGFYTLKYHLIVKDPSRESDGEITKK